MKFNFSSIRHLNLGGNLITRIHPEWFAVLIDNIRDPKDLRKIIRIENEPLKCDCNLFTLQVSSSMQLI